MPRGNSSRWVACTLGAVALVACSKKEPTTAAGESELVAAASPAASSAGIERFQALEKAALTGDYQAQRNVATWLSGGNNGEPPLNPILACAWRLVILQSGDQHVDDSDVGNKQLYCDTRLDADGVSAAQSQATALLASISAAKGKPPGPQGQGAARPVTPPAGSSEEVREMYRRASPRLVFRTDEARRMVEEFNVPCPNAKDGRHLPLMNVLIARLAQMDGKVVYATTIVDSRGQEARVSDVITRRADGRVTDEGVALTLNAWGELRSGGISVEAVQNACYGSYGPIWIVGP
ncbi:MAG: hypothetical protein E6R08_08995 [Nevskiaceae bacterium]|nr:MAG: hypothetical protein E6R08_08995 [Nevskiaceae bacterium]